MATPHEIEVLLTVTFYVMDFDDFGGGFKFCQCWRTWGRSLV